MNNAQDLRLDVAAIADEDLAKTLVKQLKQKSGLHRRFVGHLPAGEHPPIAQAVLGALKEDLSVGPRVNISAP